MLTHSSINNNDGRQETYAVHHTTHHTNSLLFQPILPEDESRIVLPGDTVIDVDQQNDKFQDVPLYKIGKLVPLSLCTNYEDSTAHNLLDKCFAMDLIWALAGGIPDNINDEPLPLLGSWTTYQKAVCNSEVTISLFKYLPANVDPPGYSDCKEYFDFMLDTMRYLEIPHIFAHADEQVYARILQLIWKHKYLSISGHGSTLTGLPCSAIHGDLVNEHFNRKTKETIGHFRSGYSTDLQVLNRVIKDITYVLL